MSRSQLNKGSSGTYVPGVPSTTVLQDTDTVVANVAGTTKQIALADFNDALTATESNAQRLSKMLAVSKRPPSGYDNDSDYQSGVSRWIEEDGTVSLYNGTLNGSAIWGLYPNPGTLPLDALGLTGVVSAVSMRRLTSTYSGALIDVSDGSGNFLGSVGFGPDNQLDYSALTALLAPFNYKGYITKRYDQSGNANHWTNSDVSLAPMIDLRTLFAKNAFALHNNTRRQYYAGVTFPVVGTNGSPTLTFTINNGISYYGNNFEYITKGMICTGTNVPVGATVLSVDYVNFTVTLSANAMGAVNNVSFKTSIGGSSLDCAAIAVTNIAYSVVMSVCWGAVGSNSQHPIAFGVVAGTAAGGVQISSLVLPGIAANLNAPITGGRFVYTNGVTTSALSNNTFGKYITQSPQVIAYAIGGTSGRDLTYQWEGQQNKITNYLNTTTTGTLTGAVLGFNQQFGSITSSGDVAIGDVIVLNRTITQAEMTKVSASIELACKYVPQIVENLVINGSSTTFGNGTDSFISWGSAFIKKYKGLRDFKLANMATGGTIALDIRLFSQYAGQMPSYRKNLPLLYHPGMGNTIQQTGTFTVSATDTVNGILTCSTSFVNTNMAPGIKITGNVNLPAGASIASVDMINNRFTVDAAHKPTGNVGTITIVPSTGADAYNSLVSTIANAISNGFSSVIVEGSATRASFTGTIVSGQVAEFNNFKVFVQENIRNVSGVLDYLDYEDDPAFGDGGLLTVLSVDTVSNPNTVTVSATNAYSIVNGRIAWAGMVNNLVTNVAGQYITAVSGTTLSLSGSAAGITVGGKVHVFNNAPWLSSTSMWPADRQHFTQDAYDRQGNKFAQLCLSKSYI